MNRYAPYSDGSMRESSSGKWVQWSDWAELNFNHQQLEHRFKSLRMEVEEIADKLSDEVEYA